VRSFSTAVQRSDPEGAVAWASTLSDANQRQSQVENITRDWLRSDTDAARQWLSSSHVLSEEVKARLLKSVR
jgi:hypothetical protein